MSTKNEADVTTEADDPVLRSFLECQYEEAMALAESSDILELFPFSDHPPCRYVAVFRCRGRVLAPSGEVAIADRFDVGIRFPHDYLRRARTEEVLTLLAPRRVWHPNVSLNAPFVCAGNLQGMSLVELLYQLWELLTWRKVTMREDNALNAAACAWARVHHREPTDPRPLKRRPRGLRFEDVRGEGAR